MGRLRILEADLDTDFQGHRKSNLVWCKSIRSIHFPNTCPCKPRVYLAAFGRYRPLKFRPNPMTLKVTEFPDAAWQEGSLQGDEENKKKFMQMGQAVPQLFNFGILMTLKVNFKVIVDEIWLVHSIQSQNKINKYLSIQKKN